MDTSEQAASAAPWEGRSARTNFSSLEIMKGLGFARESGSKPTSPPLLATAALTLRAVPAEMEKSDSYKSPVGSRLSALNAGATAISVFTANPALAHVDTGAIRGTVTETNGKSGACKAFSGALSRV